MAFQLPLIPSVAQYRFVTTLDSVPYTIDIRWNSREENWYMDLYTEEGVEIARGLKLVLGAIVGARSASADMPPGTFSVVDLSGDNLDAGFDDLGIRVMVWYTTEQEILDA